MRRKSAPRASGLQPTAYSLQSSSSLQPPASSLQPSGFSLLEVVLSLAIFAAVLVVLSQLVDTGVDGAVGAEDSTAAQLYAESIMAGYTSGTVVPVNSPAASVANGFINMYSQTLLPSDEEWTYEVLAVPVPSGQAGIEGLMEVTVTVRRKGAAADDPGFTLVRWIRDPNQQMADPAAEEASDSSSSSSSSSSNSSTNTGAMP